mmetsp:Transcript_23633/g.69921  ORF Transcript_23633/g.69921 Transcript_23633/m.69921 type:complete len:206 (-) Transcript_23633:1276-1893(-)
MSAPQRNAARRRRRRSRCRSINAAAEDLVGIQRGERPPLLSLLLVPDHVGGVELLREGEEDVVEEGGGGMTTPLPPGGMRRWWWGGVKVGFQQVVAEEGTLVAAEGGSPYDRLLGRLRRTFFLWVVDRCRRRRRKRHRRKRQYLVGRLCLVFTLANVDLALRAFGGLVRLLLLALRVALLPVTRLVPLPIRQPYPPIELILPLIQ